jgi:hypothetical protein
MHSIRHVALATLALAWAAGASAATPRYRALNETPYGKAWVAERKDAKTVSDAIRLTFADATGYFGSKPKLGRAYEDSRGGRAGGATFTIDAEGVALRGWMTCEVGAKAARVTVAVIRADAPAGEWQRLVRPEGGRPAPSAREDKARPSVPATAGGALPQPAQVPLRRHAFEDGVATVGLAEGWTTPTRAAMDGVLLQGPEDESVWINVGYNVQTPQGVRAPGMLVAPLSPPLQAFQAVFLQVNRWSVSKGGPDAAFDHMTQVTELKSVNQGGRQALLRYGVTERRRDGRTVHYQAVAQVDVAPLVKTAWRLNTTGMRAPDALLERDLPMMLQMVQSLKYDEAAIARRNGERLTAQQQWFANQQAGHRAQEAANDAQHQRYWDTQKQNAQRNKSWEDRQVSQDRRNDDFSELTRGYRTVEDTRTGERRSADYLNVDKIVEDLNVGEPDRYKQIPLRDELHPLDGR